MGWNVILQGLLMTSMSQRVKQAGKKEIFSSGVYLPLVYFFTAAPSLLLLLGFALFVTTGVAQLYPEFFFPTQLILILATISVVMSGIMLLIYRSGLKFLLRQTPETAIENSPINIEEKIQGAFAPIIKQLKEEQSMFKNTHFRSEQ